MTPSSFGLPIALTFARDPYFAPAVLLVCALVGALLAAGASRRHAGPRRAAAIAGHTAVVLLALAAATGTMIERARVFWGAHWEDGGRTLVLERLGWLPDVRLDRDAITAITEYAAQERAFGGPRGTVRYVVRAGGRAYWSAPVRRAWVANRARELLTAATGHRLERFQVGHPVLAD
ncbi:MAG: hypothetical protein D6718_10500 [Acidobacteria bacterium]|nr:MAG: hypothetical protein D6718_10500 [Acidobacteriota bacterium]